MRSIPIAWDAPHPLLSLSVAVRSSDATAVRSRQQRDAAMKEPDRVLRSLLARDGTAALSEVLAVFVQCKRVEAERAQSLLREQEARRQALRVRDHFVAAASHDLRTPFATIVSHTGLLQGHLRRQQDLLAAGWRTSWRRWRGRPGHARDRRGDAYLPPFLSHRHGAGLPGASLGLAGSKTIVEHQWGHISVASAPGVEAMVVVVLPPPGQRPAPRRAPGGWTQEATDRRGRSGRPPRSRD